LFRCIPAQNISFVPVVLPDVIISFVHMLLISALDCYLCQNVNPLFRLQNIYDHCRSLPRRHWLRILHFQLLLAKVRSLIICGQHSGSLSIMKPYLDLVLCTQIPGEDFPDEVRGLFLSLSCRAKKWARCGPYPCWSEGPQVSKPWRTWCHYSRSPCCWTTTRSAPWTGTRSPLKHKVIPSVVILWILRSETFQCRDCVLCTEPRKRFLISFCIQHRKCFIQEASYISWKGIK